MDKKSYAFGMSVASSFYQQGIRIASVEDFLAGLRDMLTGGKIAISMDEAGQALEQFYKELEEETTERASVRAFSFVSAPVTVISMRCVAPSPSPAMRTARFRQTVNRAS